MSEKTWQEMMQEGVDNMPVDATIVLKGPKGWELELKKLSTDGDVGHRAFNPGGPDGKRIYYETNNYPDESPYGAPKIIQEPDLGIPLRDAGIEKDGELVGFLVLDDKFELVTLEKVQRPMRFSVTNPVLSWKVNLEVTSEGEFKIDGRSYGFIHLIWTPDLNRMKGWVGYVLPTKPEGDVEIYEMDAVTELLKLRAQEA
jgi:hypothetical protein